MASGTTRALVLCGLLAVLAVLLLLSAPHAPPIIPGAGWPHFVAICACFLFAEWFMFNLEYRRNSFGFSLSEVPTALALVVFDPWIVVAARVLGSALPLLLKVRRTGKLKQAFNTCLMAFEAALAAAMLAWVNTYFSLSDSLSVLTLTAALLASSVVGGLFVALVIAQFEGHFVQRLPVQMGQGLMVWVLGAVMGAVTVTPLFVDPWLVTLSVVPIILVWRLLMNHGALRQRHMDVVAQHDFAREVGQSLDLHTLVTSARVETQRLLRAQDAGLVVFLPDAGHPVVESSTDRRWWPRSVGDPSWQDVLHGGDSVVRLTTEGSGARSAGWSDALATRISDNEGIIGVLVVAERTGLLKRFSNDDMERLRQLADQLAVSLRKSLLHIRLEHDASHDRLTGLPNRALFEVKVQAALGGDGPVAVYLLDLDRFKEVNDGLGHHVGDVLLQKFAGRVRSVLPPGTVISRLAGDEFALLATGLTRSRAAELGARILQAAREPFDLGELSVVISCSIGLTIGPEQGNDAPTLLRRADLAMYEAKSRSGGVSVYRPDLEASSIQRLRLLQDLRVAAVDEQMQAWFQPKIHLGTNTVVGVEALVRWDHPDQGVLDADRFVGLAEQTDLIHTITDRMLTAALAAARTWRRRGWTLGVAVNVSARSLLDELLADRIARHLHHHDVPAGLLTVEITETSVMADVSRALVTLERLSDLGVELSVDDYGTGYSSLAYLRRLPVRELKIDRGFIANVLTDDHDEVIVRSTIDLGRHLGLRVVAEGVETDRIAGRLRQLGCDLGQGTGFAAPMPISELERWLVTGPYLVQGDDRGGDALATA
jgi:diguanylate cyclase (GGDEF)-like protein